MKGKTIIKTFLVIIMSSGSTFSALAADGKPVCSKLNLSKDLLRIRFDTIPPPVVAVETATNPVTQKPVATVIKAVPKARKVPVPVQVKVAPVKIVKPKIVKPVIKILN